MILITSLKMKTNNPPNTAIMTVRVHFKVSIMLFKLVICVKSSIWVLLMRFSVSLSF